MSQVLVRRGVLAAVAALVLGLATVLVVEDATGGEGRISEEYPDGITVVGDSITALYNDEPGHPRQGWWSFVGRHFTADVDTYAQSGSGYQRPGNACTGDRFMDRDAAFADPPSLFIVEGGRNDWALCREGVLVETSDAIVAAAVNRYFTRLREELPASTRIVVLSPPWGPIAPWEQRRITSIVHAAAVRHGLEYVDTRGTLDVEGRTTDGVHPNRAGSKALGERVIGALLRDPADNV